MFKLCNIVNQFRVGCVWKVLAVNFTPYTNTEKMAKIMQIVHRWCVGNIEADLCLALQAHALTPAQATGLKFVYVPS
jgi:hypothetical protein